MSIEEKEFRFFGDKLSYANLEDILKLLARTDVEVVIFYNCGLDDVAVDLIVKGLLDHPTLKTLLLQNNQGITNMSVPLLKKLIKDNKSLKNVSVHDTSISDENWFELYDSLQEKWL